MIMLWIVFEIWQSNQNGQEKKIIKVRNTLARLTLCDANYAMKEWFDVKSDILL